MPLHHAVPYSEQSQLLVNLTRLVGVIWHITAASCYIKASQDAEAHLWRCHILVTSCCAGALALAGADSRRRRRLLKLLLGLLLGLLLVLVPEQVLARVRQQPPRPEIRRLWPR